MSWVWQAPKQMVKRWYAVSYHDDEHGVMVNLGLQATRPDLAASEFFKVHPAAPQCTVTDKLKPERKLTFRR